MQLPKTEMNIFETILARRSVRSYTPQEVDAGTLRTMLEAAVRAPTAMHEEPWAFAIIQDKQMLRNLSDRAKPLFIEQVKRSGHTFDIANSADFNIFYDAGTLIIICTKETGTFVAADCWLAAENLMLAACAMGVGTCVVGAALLAMNIPEVKAGLGIPNEFTAIAPIIAGYPKGITAPSARKKPFILVRH
jgi:nitroreductase